MTHLRRSAGWIWITDLLLEWHACSMFPVNSVHSAIWRHSANGWLGGVCARCWLVTGGWWGHSQNCTPYMGSGHGSLAGDWPSTGGVLNITAAVWTGGVLVTKSERKMLVPGCNCLVCHCTNADGWTDVAVCVWDALRRTTAQLPDTRWSSASLHLPSSQQRRWVSPAGH